MWDKFVHKTLRVPYPLHTAVLQSPKHPAATVILLHGIGSSLEMWRGMAKKMPGDVRIIAVDLLGFGASPKPRWDIYGATTQADSLVTTLFRLKVSGSIVVVGHSLGSLVAVEFARRYPFMTKSLVLISPPLYRPDRNPKRFDFKPEEVLRKAYQLMADRPEMTERALRMAGKYNVLNKGFNADNVDVAAYLATLQTAIINQNSYTRIVKIRRPIHIITGRFDPIVLDETIKELERIRPNVTRTSTLGGHEIVGRMQTVTLRAVKQAIDEAKARAHEK